MNSARVVVIGGGVVGCAVLYHLAKGGWRDVLLLERRELTSGSSWHAAGGLFTVTRPNAAAAIHKYTFESYQELEKSGLSCGFHSTGGLNICRTREELESNAVMRSACRRLGIESHFISPAEAKARAPVVDARCMVGALWEEQGGHVDAASATRALAAAARKLGAEVRRHTPVTATRQRADGSWDVVTDQETVHAEYVVNAAGLWGREVAALAGITLPLMPVEHHYLITEAVPLIAALDFELPQLNDNETGCYARQEGKGLLLGAYEKTCTHWALRGTPAEFGDELLPNDLSRMEWNFQKAVEILPCLGEAGVKRVINGPMIFSPDLGPLLGPHPALRNYFCANGVMAGFNQGAGIGRALAEWIMQGEPELDLFCWDVARFGPWAGKSYVRKTTRYFYENRAAKVFPYQEFDAGRPVHKPAVYGRLKKAGAVFGFSFGLEHPNWFAKPGHKTTDSLTYRQPNWWKPVAEEGKRVRNELGLMEFSAMAKFEVTGPDCKNWLNFIMANKMPKPGRIALSPMLSPRGRLVGDFSIARIAPQRFMVFGADAMQLCFMRHFRYYFPRRGVTVNNLSTRYGGLHICGPNAQALMAKLTDRDMDSAAFPFLSAAEASVGGIGKVLILRLSFTGEAGYEMYLQMDKQALLFDRLLKEGQHFGLALVGTRCLMHTRLEKSFPAWGLELSPEYSVAEAQVARFVNLDKEEFIGRGALLDGQPPRQRFVTVSVEAGDGAVWGDEAIFLDGEAVGYVTSGGYGPATERHIALGYVNADAYRVGGNYGVEILGALLPAELHPGPLYDPYGARMRA